MSVWQDFKENLGTTRDIFRGDDVEVENNDAGETSPLSRRKLLISAGSVVAGWEGIKRTPGAAVTVGQGIATGADRAGDAVFGNGDVGLNVYNPSPNENFEGEIPYDVAAEVEGEAVFDLMLDGEEVISQTLTQDAEFEGNLTPDEEGTYIFGVGISPQSNNPGDVSDVSEHQEYAKFQVGFSPEDALEPDDENTETDSGLEFGDVAEEDYLEQPLRSRNRFEARLDGAYEDVDLGELRVDVYGKDEENKETRYILDNEESDLDYGGLRLDGTFLEDNGNVVGFDESFAEDLYDLSRNNADEFTDFLEYAKERAD